MLGTSGRVIPKSEDAWLRSLLPQVDVALADGRGTVYLAPGGFGERAARERFGAAETAIVQCSNFVGDLLDRCVDAGVERVVLVGHAGKLVKVAAGIWNTHSRYGDARLETLAALAAAAGAPPTLVVELLELPTAEAAGGAAGRGRPGRRVGRRRRARRAARRASAPRGAPAARRAALRLRRGRLRRRDHRPLGGAARRGCGGTPPPPPSAPPARAHRRGHGPRRRRVAHARGVARHPRRRGRGRRAPAARALRAGRRRADRRRRRHGRGRGRAARAAPGAASSVLASGDPGFFGIAVDAAPPAARRRDRARCPASARRSSPPRGWGAPGTTSASPAPTGSSVAGVVAAVAAHPRVLALTDARRTPAGGGRRAGRRRHRRARVTVLERLGEPDERITERRRGRHRRRRVRRPVGRLHRARGAGMTALRRTPTPTPPAASVAARAPRRAVRARRRADDQGRGARPDHGRRAPAAAATACSTSAPAPAA